MNDATAKRATFRKLHDSGFFVLPNAWDAGSAVRFERLGFKAIASTSAGAAWAAGKQDGELGLDAARIVRKRSHGMSRSRSRQASLRCPSRIGPAR
jgi:2-methylisocitrate lyase-like PEP mutase family enzyme